MRKEEWYNEFNEKYISLSTDRFHEIQDNKDHRRQHNIKSAKRFQERYGANLSEFDALSLTEKLNLPIDDPRAKAAEARFQKLQFIDRRQLLSASDHDRLKSGFHWPGGFFGGKDCSHGYFRNEFTEQGLRTETYADAPRAILRKFVQSIPRRGKTQSSYDKGELYRCPSKLQALDMAQIMFNTRMRSIMRVDLDAEFPSEWELKQEIQRCGVRLPMIVTWHPDPLNPLKVIRPHLYWLINDAVCFSPNGRKAPMRLFELVLRSITYALVGIGADLGGLASPNRGKNPISPLWHTSVWRTEPYVLSNEGLPETARRFEALADGLDLTISREKVEVGYVQGMVGTEVETKTGTRTKSNKLFNICRKAALSWAHEKHPDAGGSGTIEELQDHIWNVSELSADNPRHQKFIHSIAKFAFDNFDPNKMPRSKRQQGNRFICADEITEGMSLSARQAVGATHTATVKRSRSHELVWKARIGMERAGLPISSKAISEFSGIPLRTVQRYFQHAPLATLIYSKGQGSKPIEERNNVLEASSESIEMPENSHSKTMKKCIPSFLRKEPLSHAEILKGQLLEYILKKEKKTGMKLHNDNKIILFGETGQPIVTKMSG